MRAFIRPPPVLQQAALMEVERTVKMKGKDGQ